MESTESNKPAPKARARVAVNYAWCKKCGICIAFCPTHVFTADEFGAPIISLPEKCTNCGLCVIRCPEFTIKLEAAGEGQPGAGVETKKGAA
jgi:2-oxoglutarate ferredoxin oxidoreductase subunit delta